MSSNKKRLNLSFSMASPIQRQAWKKLMDIPAGKRTDHVCRMICEHKNQQELLDAVRAGKLPRAALQQCAARVIAAARQLQR